MKPCRNIPWIMSVPQNIVMDLNNVMKFIANKKKWPFKAGLPWPQLNRVCTHPFRFGKSGGRGLMWRGHRGRRGNRWPLSSLSPLGLVAGRTAIDITIAGVNSELQRHRLNFPSLMLLSSFHRCIPCHWGSRMMNIVASRLFFLVLTNLWIPSSAKDR